MLALLENKATCPLTKKTPKTNQNKPNQTKPKVNNCMTKNHIFIYLHTFPYAL